MKVIYARIGDEVHDAVSEVSRLSGIPMAAVVDRLLRKALALGPDDSFDTAVAKVAAREAIDART